MALNPQPRYRFEDGKTCIDLKLANIHQLFDGRDPAPFRERDIDEDAVEYILGALQEIQAGGPIRITVWLEKDPGPELSQSEVADALHAHFGYEVEKLNRRVREHVRQGQITLGVGLAVLTVFLTLANQTKHLPDGNLQQILREGFVIIGWVAMWRPLEVLLYDWWPLVRHRRFCARLAAAEVRVLRSETAPGAST